MELIAAAELVVHAGDFSSLVALEELERIGPPLVAVAGNVDEPALSERLPAATSFEHGGARVGLIHDAGPRRGRLERMRRRFPDADAVVFGHSHLPLLETGEDGFQIFNPGSPTERRRAPTHTMGTLDTDRSGRPSFELIELDPS